MHTVLDAVAPLLGILLQAWRLWLPCTPILLIPVCDRIHRVWYRRTVVHPMEQRLDEEVRRSPRPSCEDIEKWQDDYDKRHVIYALNRLVRPKIWMWSFMICWLGVLFLVVKYMPRGSGQSGYAVMSISLAPLALGILFAFCRETLCSISIVDSQRAEFEFSRAMRERGWRQESTGVYVRRDAHLRAQAAWEEGQDEEDYLKNSRAYDRLFISTEYMRLLRLRKTASRRLGCEIHPWEAVKLAQDRYKLRSGRHRRQLTGHGIDIAFFVLLLLLLGYGSAIWSDLSHLPALPWLALVYVVMSLVTFGAITWDKRIAQKNASSPESMGEFWFG